MLISFVIRKQYLDANYLIKTYMKKILLLSLLGGFVVLMACKEEEKMVDPLVGLWELDEFALDIEEDGFTILEFRDLQEFDEDRYTFLFNEDFTFVRTLENVTVNGVKTDLEEEGEWEIDDDELELDADDGEIGAFLYDYDIEELTENSLILSFNTQDSTFEDTKIIEWVNEGILTPQLVFTVSGDTLDSIRSNFLMPVHLKFLWEFDKED